MKTNTHKTRGNEMNNMNIDELLKEFKDNGINTDTESKRHQYVLDFQDCIGHMSFNDVCDTFSDLDKNRRGDFLWAACTCLDKDSFLEIIKKAVCQSVIYEEESRLNNMYTDRLADLKIREQNMTELEKQNAVNVERIKLLEMEASGLRGRCNSYIKKSDSFDTIRRLLIA